MIPNSHQYHLHAQHQHLSPYPTPPPSTESKCGSRGNNVYMEENDGGSTINLHSHPHPPPGWVKPHHLQPSRHHLSDGSPSSNHGASHNYLQQSFYPEPPPPPHGPPSDPGGSGSSRPNYSSPVTSAQSPCAYYSSSEYYHHPAPPPPHFPTGTRRGDEDPSSFYPTGVGNPAAVMNPFYENQYHQYAEFPAPPPDYRLNYNPLGGGGGSSAVDYFTGPSSSSNRPSYGHHHVSTPLEFHQHSSSSHHNLLAQSSRRNAEAGYHEGSDNFSKYCYAKRESQSVIAPPPPPWATASAPPAVGLEDQEDSRRGSGQEGQAYFYAGGQGPSSFTRRCDSVPSHGPLTPPGPGPPSCSFDEGRRVKQRSQSVSYSRNFETQFRNGGPNPGSFQRHPFATPDPTKDVPVSSSPEVNHGFQNEVHARPPDTDTNQVEGDDEAEESDSASGSSSSSSPAPSPPSVDSNESDDDNMSDLEEELKKEIQSVTTTTDGSRDRDDHDDIVPNHDTIVAPRSQELFEETELSNSSLTLFESIALNTFDSPGPSGPSGETELPPGPQGGDNQLTPGHQRNDLEDLSGLNNTTTSITRQHHRRPHSISSATTSVTSEPRSRSALTQPKVMKRSFSEGDKDFVNVPTLTMTTMTLPSNSTRLPVEIPVPEGWRRDVVGTTGFVYYVSPSETKLRCLDEIKNYITADGTCKCGLSCPLHLEITFSFDPKVINGRRDEGEKSRQSCCYSHKRKIPLSEDSPLISSTREDLGDSRDGEDDGRGKQGAKKRRLGTIEPTVVSMVPATTTAVKLEPKPSVILTSTATSKVTTPSTPLTTYQNVAIPFAQQSPDTTTQTTPQRDMSPASSVSSDSLTLSGRSANTTPTPVGMKTSPLKGQGSFVWPIPPGTTPLVRPQTPPAVTASSKSNYQHHLISKRASSPCPNVDVRQIPVEQNQPPPRLSKSIGTPGASQSQRSTVGAMATATIAATEDPNVTIPILPASLGTIQFSSILPPASSQSTELGMPRLVNSTPPILSTGLTPIPVQVPSSITISVLGPDSVPAKTSLTLPKLLVQKGTTGRESTSEKSPLQRVQDVVDRFENDPTVSDDKERKEVHNEQNVSEKFTLESKILKIIADAAASGKPQGKPDKTGIRSVNPSSQSSSTLPLSLNPLPYQTLTSSIFTSVGQTVTTSSNSTVPIMTSNSILSCTPPTNGLQSNTGINLNNGNQLILQSQTDPNNPSLRYPIFQTLQPIFLNPGNGSGQLLIPNPNEPQGYIQIDQNNQPHNGGDLIHQGATMVIDSGNMSMCGGGNLLGQAGGGPRKKKKRLSKKQQQQQAQLQLQQQLLLQQLFNHQQVQQQAAQQLPLLLPPSFNLGPQGFLQPMNMNMNMNFFPTPTILTLPNLILNPADGTLFIQQPPQQLPNQQPPPPTQMAPQLKLGTGMSMQMTPTAQPPGSVMLPRTTLTTSSIPGLSPANLTVSDGIRTQGELGIDDSSRQNATPDSSTNDCQLSTGPVVVTATHVPPPVNPGPMTVSLPLGSSTNLQGAKNKGPLKSKVVSSSTATTVHKRILPQKQILPKIDSTTPSVENNN